MSRQTLKISPWALRLIAFTLVLVCLGCLAPTAFAKTYVITDGDRTLTYTTFATDPAQVLDRAGVALEKHDSYTAHADDAITIRRGLEVTFLYRGQSLHTTSPGETVEEFITRMGVVLTQNDALSHDLSQPITDGMTLRLDTTVTRQETYTSVIPYETTYCADASAPQGTETVLIPGQDGELLCTAEVTYFNGRETRRRMLDATQTIAPVTQIVAQGTAQEPQAPEKSDMPIIGDGYILMPSGEVLTYYKTDNVTATGYTHTDAGCDQITATGTTVHYGTVAVDPRFIPYGTRMLIVSHDGERYYGIATAEDCGGAIKRDKMDLYFPTYEECIEFGRRRCTIYFLG